MQRSRHRPAYRLSELAPYHSHIRRLPLARQSPPPAGPPRLSGMHHADTSPPANRHLTVHYICTTPWSRNQYSITVVRLLAHPFPPCRILRRWSACCEEVAWAARLRTQYRGQAGSSGPHAALWPPTRTAPTEVRAVVSPSTSGAVCWVSISPHAGSRGSFVVGSVFRPERSRSRRGPTRRLPWVSPGQ